MKTIVAGSRKPRRKRRQEIAENGIAKPRIGRGLKLLQAAHGSCAEPWGFAGEGALPGAQTLLRYWSGVIPKRRLKSLKK